MEQFLGRSWVSIRPLPWRAAWASWGLNLWGEERFEPPGTALLHHPWRLAKAVTDLSDWIARMIRHLLHPRPRLSVEDSG